MSPLVRTLVATAGVLFATGFAASAPAAALDEPSDEPCFGGLVEDANPSGVLVGSACSDVIVASDETTSIQGGAGDDVIIAGENTTEVSGGDGWDYIIGNDVGIVAFGGSGDDILDGGIAPDPDQLDASAADQLNTVAEGLPEEAVGAFVDIVAQELHEAHTRAETSAAESIGARYEGEQGSSISSGFESALAADPGRDAIADAGGEAILVDHLPWHKDPIEGGSGQDELHGGRGSDTILGKGGKDRLYGGIDDDTLEGGDNADYMLGGMGTDRIDGQEGQDVAQGDATGDKMEDSGQGDGNDVISYASGAPDGFGDGAKNMSGFPNFPPQPERGVYISLKDNAMNNGVVQTGGGTESHSTNPNNGTNFDDFEHVIGTPFPDYIEGDSGANILQGGGGADVIVGGGGADTIYGDTGGDNLTASSTSTIIGGAGDDYCQGPASPTNCESKPSNWVGPRSTYKMSVGMTKQSWAGNIKAQLYVVGSSAVYFGSNGEDEIKITQKPNGSNPPKFEIEKTGTDFWDSSFSTEDQDKSPGCTYTATVVTCVPTAKTVTLVVAGFGSNDVFKLNQVGDDTDPVLIGGSGADDLTGGNYTDDFIVDGGGNDHLYGKHGDDGLVNTGGADELRGEEDDDLILSDGICQGDLLFGGGGRDSASWAKFQIASGDGVFAKIDDNKVGRRVNGALDCGGAVPTENLTNFEDLEGTSASDTLRGDNQVNQLIGRAGDDSLNSLKSTDRILANSADDDTLYCGLPSVPRNDPRADVAKVDWPNKGTDVTSGCDKEDPADPIFVSP